MREALQPFQDWLTSVVGTGHLGTGAIVLAALFLGVLTHLVISRVVRSVTKRTASELDDLLARLIRGPASKTVVLVGLYVAVDRLGLEEETRRMTGRLLLSLGALVWTLFGLRLCSALLAYASSRPDRFKVVESRTFPLFQNLSKVLVVGVSAYVFICIWGVDATGWMTSAGVLGLVIGFAAKDTLGNLFAGVFIVADAPYRLGDYIVMDDGVRGAVTHIGLRSTRLITRDDVEITIPNAMIISSKITNQSGGGHTRMRVRIKVSVSYDADVDLVREILTELAAAEPNAREEPEPRVRFRHFGESGLEFELLIWISDPELRGRTIDALNTAVLKRFRAEGVEIPYPKRDVYLHQSE